MKRINMQNDPGYYPEIVENGVADTVVKEIHLAFFVISFRKFGSQFHGGDREQGIGIGPGTPR